MAGRKTDQKTKFNRHGVNNTSLMVQNLLKSKPLLYRRYIDPKHISPPPPPVAKASVVLDSQRSITSPKSIVTSPKSSIVSPVIIVIDEQK